MSEEKSMESGWELGGCLWVIVKYAVIFVVVSWVGLDVYNKCCRRGADINAAERAAFEPYVNWGVVDEEAIYATEAAMKLNELGVAIPGRPDSIGEFLFIELVSADDDKRTIYMVHKSTACKNIDSIIRPKPTRDFDGWIMSLALSGKVWSVPDLVSNIRYCEKCFAEEERNYLSRILLRNVVRVDSGQYGVIRSRENDTINVYTFDW